MFKRDADPEFLVELIMKKNPNFILGETVFISSDEAFDKLTEITKQNN